MKVLFIGDVDGQPGRKAVTQILPSLRQKFSIDLVIANAENLTHGLGARELHINEMLSAGVDFFTSGNHIFDRLEFSDFLNQPNSPVVRPANYLTKQPGVGAKIFTTNSGIKVLIVCLLGRVFIPEETSNPFLIIDQILADFAIHKPDIIIVDIHAEATSEKRAMGFYLDGRVTAVVGTHTHVPTSDAQILPKGTAYITDVGMVGSRDSVLGMDTITAIARLMGQEGVSIKPATGEAELDAVMIDIDDQTHLAKSIKLLQL